MSSRDWLPGRNCALHPGKKLHSSTGAMHPWVKTNETETDNIFMCCYTVYSKAVQNSVCTQNFRGMGAFIKEINAI